MWAPHRSLDTRPGHTGLAGGRGLPALELTLRGRTRQDPHRGGGGGSQKCLPEQPQTHHRHQETLSTKMSNCCEFLYKKQFKKKVTCHSNKTGPTTPRRHTREISNFTASRIARPNPLSTRPPAAVSPPLPPLPSGPQGTAPAHPATLRPTGSPPAVAWVMFPGPHSREGQRAEKATLHRAIPLARSLVPTKPAGSAEQLQPSARGWELHPALPHYAEQPRWPWDRGRGCAQQGWWTGGEGGERWRGRDQKQDRLGGSACRLRICSGR